MRVRIVRWLCVGSCLKWILVGCWGFSQVVASEPSSTQTPIPVPPQAIGVLIQRVVDPVPVMPAPIVSPTAPGLEEPSAVVSDRSDVGRLPAVNLEPDLAPLVVRPPQPRSRFERLRRLLPYGLTRDPVIRYLSDDL